MERIFAQDGPGRRPIEMSERNFFAELKRRNVYKVAVAYAVVGWLFVQVATQVFPFFEIPNWAVRLVVLVIVIGFPIALVMAWAFELTPEGLKRTEAADLAAQTHSKSHAWIYIVIVGVHFVRRFVPARPLRISRKEFVSNRVISEIDRRACRSLTKAAIRRTNIFRMDYRKN